MQFYVAGMCCKIPRDFFSKNQESKSSLSLFRILGEIQKLLGNRFLSRVHEEDKKKIRCSRVGKRLDNGWRMMEIGFRQMFSSFFRLSIDERRLDFRLILRADA